MNVTGQGITRRVVLAAAALVLCVGAGAALAQAWPAKPIRIVVGFPPGGGNDIIARLVGIKLQEALGQPVVIENRPGANSIIAAELVAKAAPDGYTLLVNATGGMSVNPGLYAKLPYDPVRDFVPISLIGEFPIILAVHTSVPANTAAEFIAYARANPGKLRYSAASTSFQLATELFKQATGTQIEHIPYKGSTPAVNALIAGDVQMSMVDTPQILPQVRAGKLRGLAVATPKRLQSAPDIPTLTESALPGFEIVLWVGLFAPAGTPQEIIAKLSAESVRIGAMPDVRERLFAMGVIPVGSSAEQLAERMRIEIPRYTEAIRKGNIRVD